MDSKSSIGLIAAHPSHHHSNPHHHHQHHHHHHHHRLRRTNPSVTTISSSTTMANNNQNHNQNGGSLMVDQEPTLPSSSSSSSSANNTPTTNTTNCAACHKPIRERFLLQALDQLWHEDCLKCSCCDCRLGEVGSTLFIKANLILCKRDYLRMFGATGFCSACNKKIPAYEMVMRVRDDRVYHLDCFQCSQCNHRFCIGDRFHLHDNRILCEYDYEEIMVFGNNNNNAPSCNGVDDAHSSSNTSDNNSLGPNAGNKISINDYIEKLKKQTESLSCSFRSNQPNTPPSRPPSSSEVVPAPLAAVQQPPQPVNNHNSPPLVDDGSSGYGSPDSLLSDGR